MPVEREPPRESSWPQPALSQPAQVSIQETQAHTASPAFGQTSQPGRSPNVFNVPRSGSRPEHHRPYVPPPPLPAPGGQIDAAAQYFQDAPTWRPVNPLHPQPQSTQNSQGPPRLATNGDKHMAAWNNDVMIIPRPAHFAHQQRPKPGPVRPVYSTAQFKNQSTVTSNFVDLTSGMSKYNSGPYNADPYVPEYVDAAKANESIKALLEGSIEDEEDKKPKTRLRRKKKEEGEEKKKKEGGEELAGEMDKLRVDEAEKQEPEDEDEEGDDGTIDGLNVKLLPHQVEGVAWMRDKEVREKKKKHAKLPNGGILADDMGLGKTLQSISLILINPCPAKSDKDEWTRRKLPEGIERNTLVVAPLALIKQWEKEIKERVTDTAQLKVCVHHGPSRTKRFEDLKKYDVVITTYQVLVSEHNTSSETAEGLKTGCFGLHWYRVILDEAHSIKNRNAKASQACYALRSVYRWCLTGTPMQNGLDELQSLIKFLRIQPYDDLSMWREQITRPMSNGRGDLAIKRLQYILKAFMKRRTKDILKKEGALVPGGATKEKKEGQGKTEGDEGFRITQRNIEKIDAEFSEKEFEFYSRLEQRTDQSLERMMQGNNMSYANALVLLLRLRQVCNHPDLIKGKLSKDKDALSVSEEKKPKKQEAEVDDIADMLGGLSVQTKQCEGCLADLSKEAAARGEFRCAECAGDIDKFDQKRKPSKMRRRNRRVVTDSDDEDEEEAEEEEEAEDSGSDADVDTPISSTKIRHLLTILHRESSEHKFIVFSQFTSMLDMIEPFLRRDGLKFTRYDGGMRNDMREASLERLRHDSGTRILLCSLKCGSLGLNLTAASRVVILEPFWNPFVEEQAIDRVHRLNQTVDVTVYKITIKNSVEQRILELQEKKRELAKAAVEGKAVAKLSMRDIMNLFGRDAEHSVQAEEGTTSVSTGLEGGVLSSGRAASSAGAGSSSGGLKGTGRKEDPLYGRRW